MTIPTSDRVSTENGWKSVLVENVNCVNLNHFQLKRLIPIERDLKIHCFLSIKQTIRQKFVGICRHKQL